MPFSESMKLEAKKRANFKCCICQAPFVEVHHILPQADAGADELDNAAPLCGGCHQRYGGNPELRKQLREMRDHWWAICSQRPPQESIYQHLDAFGNDLAEIKRVLVPFFTDRLREVETAQSVAGLSNSMAALSTGSSSLAFDYVKCQKCGGAMYTIGNSPYRCDNCQRPPL